MVTMRTGITDLNIPAPCRLDERRIEVIANRLPLWNGAELAVDTTLVAPLTSTGQPRRRGRYAGAALHEARQKPRNRFTQSCRAWGGASPHCSLERFSHACRHACPRSFPAFNASFKCNHRRRGSSSLGAALSPTPRSFNNSKSLTGPIASPTLDFLCGLPFLAFGFFCEWARNLSFSETRCRIRWEKN